MVMKRKRFKKHADVRGSISVKQKTTMRGLRSAIDGVMDNCLLLRDAYIEALNENEVLKQKIEKLCQNY